MITAWLSRSGSNFAEKLVVECRVANRHESPPSTRNASKRWGRAGCESGGVSAWPILSGVFWVRLADGRCGSTDHGYDQPENMPTAAEPKPRPAHTLTERHERTGTRRG